MQIQVAQAKPSDASTVADMVGELLREIMEATGDPGFRFERTATECRAQTSLTNEVYKVLIARRADSGEVKCGSFPVG